MDFNEIITFEGGINTDDTPQSMPKGDYRDFSYCRLGYNSGNAFAVETSAGTIEINNSFINPEDKILGATQWLKENAIVYFVYKYSPPPVPPFPLPPIPHQIWVYYIATQTHELAVQDITLNFSPDWPIFHANVIDDILKWTDGRWDPDMYEADGTRLFNPPYQINLRKALDGFYTIIDLQTIDAIKWPMEPPIVSYFTDTTRNDNKLRGKLFKFIIQPIYENGELGVWSMYSNLPLPDQSELVSGTNWVFLNNDNVIKIQFDTGPKVIRGFNLAVQQYDRESFGATPPFGVFLQLDKVIDNIGDNTFHTINFYGEAAISPAIEVFKNYDRLPITADCQEYLPTNQITYTNFREGYDKPSDAPFLLDVQMSYNVNEIRWNPAGFKNLFKVSIASNYFVFQYDGDATADVNNTFIFQVGDILQWTSWSDGSFTNNPFDNIRVYYSISQEDVDAALLLPSFFDQNAYIMQLLGDSFLEQWGVPGYFQTPGTIASYSTSGMKYSAMRRVGFNGPVITSILQPYPATGDYVIFGGDFNWVSNVKSNNICRVKVYNDTTSFASTGEIDGVFSAETGTGFNDTVLSVKVQADNYIVVGGKFTDFNGNARSKIARLQPNGALDASFNVGIGFNGDVRSVYVQPDGKILVGGDFTSYNTQPVNLIARLNSDGTLDDTFTSPVTSVTFGSSRVNVIGMQTTNKIIIAGFSLGIPSAVSSNMARLNTDGSYDGTFAGNPNDEVLCMEVSTNSAIGTDTVFIGGLFTVCNSSARTKLAKLDVNGALDGTFSGFTISYSGGSAAVYSIKIERPVGLGNNAVHICGKWDLYDYSSITSSTKPLLRINGINSSILLSGGIPNAPQGTFSLGWPMTMPYVDPGIVWVLGDFIYEENVLGTVYKINRGASFYNNLYDAFSGAGLESYSELGHQDFDGDLPRKNDWSTLNLDYDKVTGVVPSLKVGATHEFGIVYGDRAYRDNTVYTVDSMNLFVPWFYDISNTGALVNFKNPFAIVPNIEINHVPPVWADRYWIVAKPATEILSFGQYVTNKNDGTSTLQSSILKDPNAPRYKVYIDNYYETSNKGASIRHEIKVGDKLRFKRSNWYYLQYLPYLELDITGVEVDASAGNRTVVYTNLFDKNAVSIGVDFTSSANELFGQEIEIYTPRPSTDDTGNVFVSTWKDITDPIQIINPHTENRSHGSPAQYYLQWSPNIFSGSDFYISGDQSQLAGTTWPITVYNADGSSYSDVTNVNGATYDTLQNITRIQLSATGTDITIAYVTLNGQDQIVNALTNITSAYYSINYGDVYLRQRNYRTGVTGAQEVKYYYMEDFNYSDYYPSDIHNDGRLRIEDQNAKMVHRKASSIHSDTFIFGTQINGLSSFGLDNQNIEDMNPLYGEIVRTYMSGREGKTLKCLQPKRENSIYIQFYPNEVGSDSTVRVSNRTFASWFDYKSLFGCTDAGATALLPNGAVMYFDNNSGVFIYSGANGQMVVSEIDPDTGKDYKFRTKTKQLAKAYNESANPLVRTYINETVGEVGFAFSFDNEETYEHVVFDYVNMRWRSTYDYNFRQFCNLGQTLVGWGKNNQLYLHNQDGVWTFHGDSFIQKVKFVSNENPLLLKRYQDITLISDDKFSIEAISEPNKSYPLGMKTMMGENLLGIYEGYGKTNYRKNLYDPKFWIDSNISTTNSTTWTLNGNQTTLNGEMITIIQDSDKNIYTGIIDNPVYNSGPNTTDIEIVGLEPGTTGVTGRWYLSEKVLLNGEDVRANALTHTLSYDPAATGASGEGSVLFSVGIKGVLS